MNQTIKALKFTPEFEQAVLEKKKSETRRPLIEILELSPKTVGPITEFKPSDTRGYDWSFRRPDMGWCDVKTSELLSVCPYGSIGRWFPVGSSTQQITGIRIERIQDITKEGAIAEGISVLNLQDADDPSAWWQSSPGQHQARTPVKSFRLLWESLYPGSWERNDWVWVIQFAEVA
jgi:hypothetical protein